MVPAGLAVESSEDSSDEDDDDSDDDDGVEDSEGGEETCPPGCDPSLYDKVHAYKENAALSTSASLWPKPIQGGSREGGGRGGDEKNLGVCPAGQHTE